MCIRTNGLVELWHVNGAYCVIAPGHYIKFQTWSAALIRFNSFNGHILTQFEPTNERILMRSNPVTIVKNKVKSNLKLIA